LFELGFDVVSFDARDPDHAPAWLVAALAAQLERGVVAWGVLASEPGREVSSTAAVTALEVWCARLGHQRDAIAQSSLLTPVCGLAALDPAECTARLRALAALQQCLR
jgi:hypothetical protein